MEKSNLKETENDLNKAVWAVAGISLSSVIGWLWIIDAANGCELFCWIFN